MSIQSLQVLDHPPPSPTIKQKRKRNSDALSNNYDLNKLNDDDDRRKTKLGSPNKSDP
jgi:hypothetical protein